MVHEHTIARENTRYRIAEYTQEVARTHFILTAVTQGHANLILHYLQERQTTHYCFDSRCFHAISVLLLRAVRNVSAFIGLPSYVSSRLKIKVHGQVMYLQD